jgi:hypothetical protein
MQSNADQAINFKATKIDKEKWSLLITEWEQGVESQKQFCNRHGLNINTFTYMKKKLQLRIKPRTKSTFIPVVTVQESKTVTADALILENKSGIKLHVPLSLPTERISHLLNLLGWNHA